MNIAKMMTPMVCTVTLHADNTVRQGLEVMRHHGYTAIPVLNENNQYIGCISEGDFLRHILAVGTTDLKEHEKYRIASLVRRDFCPPLKITADAQDVIDAALKQNFVPILDDRGCLCGILTRRSVISFLASRQQPDADAEAEIEALA